MLEGEDKVRNVVFEKESISFVTKRRFIDASGKHKYEG